ncbi:Trimethyllysine dioxygenase [Diplonema papillatum]|nr:Trimethyllysine dioxygenase [Diplonema papillatum]
MRACNRAAQNRLGVIAGCARQLSVHLSVQSSNEAGVTLNAGELGSVRVSSDWLADNRPESVNPVTLQRSSDCFGVSETYESPTLRQATIDKDGSLVIDWARRQGLDASDGASLFEKRTLLEGLTQSLQKPAVLRHPAKKAARVSAPRQHILWDSATLQNEFPSANYEEVMQSDEECLRWMEKVEAFGFCLLRGCPVGGDEVMRGEVAKIAQKAGNYMRNSIFGDFWRFDSNYTHADTAYSELALPPHVDGCYSYDPPGLQMLHCVEYGATGGLTELVDGFHALIALRDDHPEAFDLLQRYVLSFTYIEPGIELRNQTPAIVTDDYGVLRQIRYNDCDRDAFPLDAPLEIYEAWHLLSRILKRESARISFQLLPGTTLVFNNWRLLHARTSFTGKRVMVGCYINMEDFDSRLRVLRKTPASAS